VSGGGMYRFLTKPIKQDVLLQAIREHATVRPASPKEECSWMAAISVNTNHRFATGFRRIFKTAGEPASRCWMPWIALTLGPCNRWGTRCTFRSMFGFQAITDHRCRH